MAIDQKFVDAVNQKDTLLARIMLNDSLIIDPTFQEFDELIGYAEKRLDDLYDKHDGEVFSNDISKWTKSLIDEQTGKCIQNFSKERISFLKKLCSYIYADRIEEKEREKFIEEHKPIITAKQVGAGMAIGGTAVAVVGGLTMHPVVAVGGAIVAVAGGVIYYNNK